MTLTGLFGVTAIVQVLEEVAVRDRARGVLFAHDEFDPAAHPDGVDQKPELADVPVNLQPARTTTTRTKS